MSTPCSSFKNYININFSHTVNIEENIRYLQGFKVQLQASPGLDVSVNFGPQDDMQNEERKRNKLLPHICMCLPEEKHPHMSATVSSETKHVVKSTTKKQKRKKTYFKEDTSSETFSDTSEEDEM